MVRHLVLAVLAALLLVDCTPCAAASSRAAAGIHHQSLRASNTRESQKDVADAVGGHQPTRHLRQQLEFALALTLGFFAALVIMALPALAVQHQAFRQVPKEDKQFSKYLWFRFSNWFAWNRASGALVLLVMTIAIMLVCSWALCLVTHVPLRTALWNTWIWIGAPNGGEGEKSVGGQIIGSITSISGLVIFALLISMMADWFSEMLDSVKNGSNAVVAGNHTVILGLTDKAYTVVDQIAASNESKRGMQTIAILTSMDKVNAESRLQDARGDHLNTTTPVRSGDSFAACHLDLVACSTARSILVLTSAVEAGGAQAADALAIRTILTLRGKGWPFTGNIIAQCHLKSSERIMRSLLQGKGEVMLVGDIVARLMVQCTRQPGLSRVFLSIFDFRGDEFHFWPVGKRHAGKTFDEVLYSFSFAVPVGLITKDGEAILVPAKNRVLEEGEEIIVVAEDDDSNVPITGGHFRLSETTRRLASRATMPVQEEKEAQMSVVLGWHERAPILLEELDAASAPGSLVTVISSVPIEERLMPDVLANVTVTHVEGARQDTTTLESIPLQGVSSIFVLADEDTNPGLADSKTVAALVHLQQRRMREGLLDMPLNVVPEILDSNTEEQVKQLGLNEYVDSNQFIGKALAMVAENRQSLSVLKILLSVGGTDVEVVPLETFMTLQTGAFDVCFWEVCGLVRAISGSIVIGWFIQGELELNPPEKFARRGWSCATDRVVVMAHSTKVAVATPRE